MAIDAGATEQVVAAIRAAYGDLILSVPLVAVGILITGSIFYFVAVRPQLAERTFSGWLKYLFPKEHYTTASARLDLKVWLINGLLVIPIYEACVVVGGLIIGVGAYGILANLFGPGTQAIDALWPSVAIQFLGFYFGIGIGQYSGHLAFHKVPCLWALHRAHHSAESPNLFAFLRSHPLEIFINGATRVIGAAAGIGIALYFTGGTLLPETAATIFWYNIVYVLVGFRSLDHTHIPIRYGKFLDILIGSPIMHEVHHSAELKHRDVNLAGAGYIYDWLFGTLYVPEKGETWRWGLNEDELGERNPHRGLRAFFVEPVIRMWDELRVLGGKRARARHSMLLVPALITVLLLGGKAQAVEKNLLRAGAASVDITPPESALKPGDRIRDHLFARALIVGNDTSCAALVGLDQGMIGNDVIEAATARIVSATKCPKVNVVISATHTHSGSTHGIEAGGEPGPKRIEDAIVDAVKQAAARMRPAQIGFGTANVNLNVNRDLYVENQWLQGPNVHGISDKTLAVVGVLGEDGLPIGVYMNYAMHPISFYLSGVVSADVPGEASRYVERRFGPGMVSIFVQGASGDQNPFLTRPLYRLVETRAGAPTAGDARISRPPPWLEMARERNASVRLTEGLKTAVPAERLPAYEAAIQDQGELVSAMGAVIGEMAINTMRYDMSGQSQTAVIRGAGASVQCPGRDRTDRDNPVREGQLPPYVDGAPVNIELRVLRIGEIYIASIDGELYSEIGLRLKREAPISRLMLTTLANGIANSGYIYSNEAASHLTFQVIGSRLKPGCAEDVIVRTVLDLVSEVRN